jgi:hypothetical protein
MNYEEVMPIFIELLTNAKIINDTNGATFIDEEGYLKPESELVIEYMFYAMLFDNKRVIMYAINSNYIKIERVFSLMLEVKTLQKPFNILPEFSTALEKLKTGKSSTKQKLDADDVYEQENMYDIWRVRHIEYLCMKLLEMKNDKAQKKIFEHYLNLVKGYTTGFFTPTNKSEITPEKLLEMAFDEAEVRFKLANLGDKSYWMPKNTSNNSDNLLTNFRFEWENVKTGKGIIPLVSVIGAGKKHSFSLLEYQNIDVYEQCGRALIYWLLSEKYYSKSTLKIPSEMTSKHLLNWIMKKLVRKFGYQYEFYVDDKTDKAFIRAEEFVSGFPEFRKAKPYTPAMFDKPQTIIDKIILWFKNDFNKKYAWEQA